STLTWRDLEWLRSECELPLVLKGILTAEDALLAAEHGASAIVVSNHGGRQLDGVPASLDALPEVVEAAGERVEVLVDGGVRRGTGRTSWPTTGPATAAPTRSPDARWPTRPATSRRSPTSSASSASRSSAARAARRTRWPAGRCSATG